MEEFFLLFYAGASTSNEAFGKPLGDARGWRVST